MPSPALRRLARLARLSTLPLALAATLGGCEATARGPVEIGTAPAGAPPAAVRAAVRAAARPITGAATDYDPLLTLVGTDARVVLLGEATHGTHEFYRERARITRRLVTERGFSAVAIEGDWPDAWRVNEYVRGTGGDRTAEEALSSFRRFPEWMWRNEEVRDLVQWLREHNASRLPAQRVGFYGLDVQSLFSPIDAVLAYLDARDAAAAARARALYACFEPYRPRAEAYGRAAAGGVTCETEARDAVAEVERLAATRPADPAAAEALFGALRAAHAVAGAEAYFRVSSAGTASAWNLRDTQMAETLDALLARPGAGTGAPGRVVVWSHNTHTGDDRHTEMGESGEINLGQLARQRHGDAAVLVGFFTYSGTVLAASAWGEPGRVRTVNPALPGSHSAIFHEAGVPDFLLVLRGGGAAADALSQPRLERAIGVVYLPQTERQSHYFTSRLAPRFDAAVFFDVTRAVTPLPAPAVARTTR